jgi:hypothetical protein
LPVEAASKKGDALQAVHLVRALHNAVCEHHDGSPSRGGPARDAGSTYRSALAAVPLALVPQLVGDAFGLVHLRHGERRVVVALPRPALLVGLDTHQDVGGIHMGVIGVATLVVQCERREGTSAVVILA